VICPPYLVHVESFDGNIGNLHPMNLGKALADIFPAIINIKRRGGTSGGARERCACAGE